MMKKRIEHRSSAHKIIPGTLLSLLFVIGCTWGTGNGPGTASVSAPGGNGLLTAINADATEIRFTMDKVYTSDWNVYTTADGTVAAPGIRASFDSRSLTLTLRSTTGPIAPRIYYVSLTEEGKPESERFPLWGEPRVDPTPMSLAKRFRLVDRGSGIPHARLIEDSGATSSLLDLAGCLTSAGAVSALFNALHGYIAAFGASGEGNTVPDILLGDWVDLPSLSVAAYIRSDGNTIANAFTASNTDLGAHGKLLRLIVVGNNSFHSGKGQDGAYTVTANDATPHLVFQFQNIPGEARMSTGSDGGGYKDTGMRSYLVPSNGAAWGNTGDSGSGVFLAGLVNAGVPDALLFAPKRYVTNNGKRYQGGKIDLATGADEIEDKVWLPTGREMFGDDDAFANGNYETAANQARLEYYTDNESRIKYNSDGGSQAYWEASPGWADDNFSSSGTFCEVRSNGSPSYISPNWEGIGVAPAFCVW
jgi:hypothetical protein